MILYISGRHMKYMEFLYVELVLLFWNFKIIDDILDLAELVLLGLFIYPS